MNTSECESLVGRWRGVDFSSDKSFSILCGWICMYSCWTMAFQLGLTCWHYSCYNCCIQPLFIPELGIVVLSMYFGEISWYNKIISWFWLLYKRNL